MNERLWRLAEIRRSVWIDSLSRDETGNGTLGGIIESGGVHSNPKIFQKAISGSSLHDKQPRELAESEDRSKPSSIHGPRRAPLGEANR